eukprot:CAMPEP_0168517196 /NCGR_PEP_ID=MMETSP0405-20121227/5884_1 /TAXON_ID=498012 /ORGANISM="Trichosphaerium sp, Strain Am-I-7 wt" /LENGTH=96 /DNA_ID=CAMNT_0008537113 /DNA_START=14 /DNA_END=304 /DNA_ORIENTATION=+
MATPVTRSLALNYYRGFLRSASQFRTYNFKSYVQRRAMEDFRANKGQSDPATIKQLLFNAKQQLEVVRRQAMVNQIYAKDMNVLEVAKAEKALGLA